MLNNIIRLLGLLEKGSRGSGIVCDTCGKNKRGKYWESDDLPGKTFCTKKCINLYGSEEYTCFHCKGEYIGEYQYIKEDPNKKFCSTNCYLDYYN